MKLKEGFTTHEFRGTQIMLTMGPAAEHFHGLVRSNDTAAFIVNQLRRETTEPEIVEAILKEYEVDRETAAEDVHRILLQLREVGAIDAIE